MMGEGYCYAVLTVRRGLLAHLPLVWMQEWGVCYTYLWFVKKHERGYPRLHINSCHGV